MKHLLFIAMLLSAILLGGCTLALRTQEGTTVSGTVYGSSEQPLSQREVQCEPNQYWDGQCCRHKGQGRGARQHDAPDCR